MSETQPFLSIVVIHRRAGLGIERLLDSIAGQADEYVFLNTGPDEAPGPSAVHELEQFARREKKRGVRVVRDDYRCPDEWTLDGQGYIGDFAAARNAAHARATGKWHLSLDADDELTAPLLSSPLHGSTLSTWLRDQAAQRPDMTCVFLSYGYSPEMQHDRPRFWRMDKAWRWEHRLHEVFMPWGHTPVCGTVPPHVLTVKHHGDPSASEQRNRAMVKHIVEAGDRSPRMLWALGAALADEGDLEQARVALCDASEDPSSQVGYFALLTLAEVLRDGGDHAQARAVLGAAMGGRPGERPAYLDLADLLEREGELERASNLYRLAYQLAPYQAYEFMSFPKFYDGAMRRQAARCCLRAGHDDWAEEIDEGRCGLEDEITRYRSDHDAAHHAVSIVNRMIGWGRVKDARALLDSLPERLGRIKDVQRAREVVFSAIEAGLVPKKDDKGRLVGYPDEDVHDFVSRIGDCASAQPGTDGRPRVVPTPCPRPAELVIDIVAKGTTLWGPRAHETRGVGGSEQAVAHLAPLLSAAGVRVDVWASRLDCAVVDHGVGWHEVEHFDPTRPRDHVVVWRDHRLLETVQGRSYPVAFWAHDIARAEYLEDYRRADKVWTLSGYHRQLFEWIGLDPEKIVDLRNGIDGDLVATILARVAKRATQRVPHRCVYCSSATRGLLTLLACWPAVRAAVPDATLDVCYGLELLRHPSLPAHLRGLAGGLEKKVRSLEPLGVKFYGGVPNGGLLELLSWAEVWAYPTIFPEISCIVAMEAQAMGAWPVTTTKGALAETVLVGPQLEWEALTEGLPALSIQTGEIFTLDAPANADYTGLLIESLRNPPSDEDRAAMQAQALSRFSWTGAVPDFLAALRS